MVLQPVQSQSDHIMNVYGGRGSEKENAEWTLKVLEQLH